MEPRLRWPSTRELQSRELRADDVPLLQALFDANPAYFQVVNGRAALPDEAQIEFDERPPRHLSWTRRWVLGWFDEQRQMAGVSIVVADLGAPGVWHLALFLLATRLHGRGLAQPACTALERWAQDQGAQWMRLGVVLANARARRFWLRQGYSALRLQVGVDTGGRVNDVQTCCKPLAGGTIADYLHLVPRDRPEPAQPGPP